MPKTIVYETSMTQVPESCLQCDMMACTLGSYSSDPSRIKKAYLTKRHSKCPLKLVDPQHLEKAK